MTNRATESWEMFTDRHKAAVVAAWRRSVGLALLHQVAKRIGYLKQHPVRPSAMIRAEEFPMSQNVAEFVWKRLNEWGLSRVYGYPGDGVGGLDVALEKAKDFMDYVQVRHEEMAAFMASAHAKFTGQPGLCYATSGPGAIHLLTGLYDAKMDHVPVVAIVGQQARSALGRELSAGGRPSEPVRRRNRICDHCGRSRAGAYLHRSRGANRAGQARGYLRDHSQRSPGTRIRGSANGSWRDAYWRRISRRRDAAGHRGSQKGGRNSQQGQRRWRSWSAQARCMRPTR